MSPVLETVGIVIGSGAAGAAVTEMFNRRKNKSETVKFNAEATQILTSTAVDLIAPLKAEIGILTGRVATLEEKERATKSLLDKAIDHIRELHRWIDRHVPGRDRPQPPPELDV